jgi:hypothetical protein
MYLIFTNDVIKKGPKILGPFFIFFLLGLFENTLFRSEREDAIKRLMEVRKLSSDRAPRDSIFSNLIY